MQHAGAEYVVRSGMKPEKYHNGQKGRYMIRAAHEALAGIQDELYQMLLNLIGQLRKAAAPTGEGRSSAGPGRGLSVQTEALSAIAHDLHCAGSTAGYPLVSRLALLLRELMTGRDCLNDAQLDMVRAIIQTFDLVLEQNITGSGGRKGDMLVQNLALAARPVFMIPKA
jgi:hypothetical protein